MRSSYTKNYFYIFMLLQVTAALACPNTGVRLLISHEHSLYLLLSDDTLRPSGTLCQTRRDYWHFDVSNMVIIININRFLKSINRHRPLPWKGGFDLLAALQIGRYTVCFKFSFFLQCCCFV